jgi:penicillin amidase
MKTIRKIAAIILTVLILAVASGWWFLSSRLPEIDGVIQAPLKSEVVIRRDRYGVPHIEAQTAEDACFALGFTVAQDRLFQMELQRRLAQGELAEILGPSLVRVDRQFRTFGYKRIAEKQLRLEEQSPDSQRALALLDAFLAGVNHFIATQKLPVEYTLIGASARPFTRIDVMSMMVYMSFSFAHGHTTDSLFSFLKDKYSDRNPRELFPGYTAGQAVTIIENQAEYNPNSKARPESPVAASARTSSTLMPGSFSLASLFFSEEGLDALIPSFHGSNSWVIAPSRSISGAAILANDPHIGLSNPAVWYEAHIKYDGFENYGYYIPIFPFPLLGHNRERAWGLTMFENDDLDLYRETFHPDDPSLVMYRGQYVPVTIIKEKIRVKGAEDEELTIRITPHGPIISEFLKGYEGPPLAMWWVLEKQPNPILRFTHTMLHARTLKDFEASMALLAAPGLNISYADSAGNIAWWAVGRLPIRPPHIHSREVLDGASGRDEITAFLPFALNPKLINPPSGIIITANNKSTSAPVGPIRDLEGYWAPTDRAARLTELLSAREKWDLESLKAVQTDVHAQAGAAFQEQIRTLIDRAALDEKQSRALDELLNWDGNARIDSIGATIYHVTLYHILKGLVMDELGPERFEVYTDSMDYWSFLKNVISNDNSACWDDVTTEKKETRKEIVQTAFVAAVDELTERMGSSIDSWQWGKLHQIVYKHPLGSKKPLNLLFNIGPYPAPAEAHFVNRMKSSFGKHDYIVSSTPSTRRLIDFSNPEMAVSILPSGNSGNFMSPYFDDQVQAFLRGEYRPMILNIEKAKDDMRHTLTLRP